MSLVIDMNNRLTPLTLRGITTPVKNSLQSSYTVITASSYTVSDESILFVNGGSSNVSLTLPSAALNQGRNIFVVNRSGTYTVNVTNTNLIDVDQDANGVGTSQTGLLPASLSWAHLFSNGAYWVIVSKSTASP